MNFLLFGSVADVVGDVFNIIWSQLNLIIYGLIVVIFRLFTNLSQLDILSADQTNGIYQRVTMVITIVMVFYITFEFIKYVVQPDTISDKEKGVGKIGMRIVIAILLIAFIPTIFNLGMRLQNKILSTNVISKVILGQDSFDFKDAGSNFAGDVFSAFYRVDYSKCGSLEECQKAQNKVDEVIKQFKEDKGALALESAMISSIFDFDDTIQYDGLLAVVFGAFILYVVFLYCIDLGVRYIQLIFLQIIAPIAAISYIVPQKDGMFQKWTKQVTTTYLDVFIRVAILYFMLLIVSILSNSLDFFEMSKNGTQINIFEYLFVIAGLLIFVQRAPKLLEELLPAKGGAASIGFGFSGKSRFEPIGKTIGSMIKPVAGTAGLVAGGLGGFLKETTDGGVKIGKKRYALNKDIVKDITGDKFKDRLKRGATYAVSAARAGYQGASTGAKTGRYSAAKEAAQKVVQAEVQKVIDGGNVLDSMFKGAYYQDVKVRLNTQIENAQNGVKVKASALSEADEVKEVKQAKAAWESAKSGGASAEEIERLRKEYKAKQSAVVNGNRVKNYIVYERDANGNIVNDEDGNPKIKEQYGPGYVYKKDDGTVVFTKRTDAEDDIRYNATKDETVRLYKLIKEGYITDLINQVDPNRKLKVPIERVRVTEDGKSEKYVEEVELDKLTEPDLRKNLGAFETAINDGIRQVKEHEKYQAASANASESKK